MTETDDIRAMRKLKFLNKTSDKGLFYFDLAKSNLFGTEEKEENLQGRRLFETSEIKEPDQTNYQIKTVRFNTSEGKLKNQSNDNPEPSNENQIRNNNSSNNDTKNINYKEIFEKQIYYDKLLVRIV